MPEDPEVELVFHESLTSLATPAFCRTVLQALATPPAHLRLDLEDVKVVDVTGPAALLQAVRLCDTRGVSVSILPSPTIYRAVLTAGVLEELPLEGPGAGSAMPALVSRPDEPVQPPRFLARTARLGLRPPTWEELETFGTWSNDPLLDQMEGSPLPSPCRHPGPYLQAFAPRALH